MFGIGIPELILVALVALVVVGPKNLPSTLRALGRAIREFQRASRELRRDAGFDEVVDEVTRPLREGLSGIEEDVSRERKGIEDAVTYEDEDDDRGFDLSMEYPEGGPDDYGALPEGASVYPDDEAAGRLEDAPGEAVAAVAPVTAEGAEGGAEAVVVAVAPAVSAVVAAEPVAVPVVVETAVVGQEERS